MKGDPRWQQGMVRAAQANFYRVWQPDGTEVLCTCRARLHKLGYSVLVGDQVWFSHWGSQGVIEGILPRQRELSRPAVANVEQALVIFALADPPLDPVVLSRFLVQVEASGLAVCLCLNKVDLVSEEEVVLWRQRLRGWGYDPLFLSGKTGKGIEALSQACQDRLSVVTGVSGAGKSTLINQLIPGLQLQTNAVSGRLRHGQHTTRHVELFPLPQGGWIADTPGFNQVELLAVDPERLLGCFPEVRHLQGTCHFPDCRHHHEPGCQVQSYPWERYPLYLHYLQELQNQGSPTPAPEANLKVLSGRGPIPRLASRYRQPSRKRQQQNPLWDPLDEES